MLAGEMATLLAQLDDATPVVLSSGEAVKIEVWAIAQVKYVVIRKEARRGL